MEIQIALDWNSVPQWVTTSLIVLACLVGAMLYVFVGGYMFGRVDRICPSEHGPEAGFAGALWPITISCWIIWKIFKVPAVIAYKAARRGEG